MSGASENWIKLSGFDIASGRYFSTTELNEGIDNVIIGKSVKDKLFEFFDPVGEFVYIKGIRFKVIGVFSEKGKSFGQDRDNVVAVSTYHFQRMYGKRRNIDLLIAAKDHDSVPKAIVVCFYLLHYCCI